MNALPPLCLFCGKPIAKRTQTRFLRTKADAAKYPGNDAYVVVDELPSTIEQVQRLSNEAVVSVRRSHIDGNRIGRFSTWDGVSYVDRFFCMGSHAQQYAYVIAREGKLAMPAYNQAIATRKPKVA